MNFNHLCMCCMEEKGTFGIKCPHCGFDENETLQIKDGLEYWNILRGQYLVGKVLGQGGFGITYIGMDMNLELKVVIKEFFPYEFAVRNQRTGKEVEIYKNTAFFSEEKRRFLEEARVLAKCNDLPGIVKVRDYFEENNTCYIVMEYLEGQTFQKYIETNGKKLSAKNILDMLQPAMKSLIRLHENGVVHRDISPDNLMITKNNKVKLIDFGSADRGTQTESSVTYKASYSPIEQYTDGVPIEKTADIYSICATLYYGLTGIPPQNVLKRFEKDELQSLTELEIAISPVQNAAIMKGLEIESRNRVKDVRDLYFYLYQFGQDSKLNDGLSAEIEKQHTGKLQKEIKKMSSTNKKNMIYIVCGVIILVFWVVHFALQNVAEKKELSQLNIEQKQEAFTEELLSTAAGEEMLSEAEDLNAMAECFGDFLETYDGPSSEEAWNTVFEQAIAEVRKNYNVENCSWMLISVTEDIPAGEVLDRGLSNQENRMNFEAASSYGVDVIYSGKGYIFYIVFMRNE